MFEALRERPELWRVHAVTTLTETVIGLVAGTILGAGLALLMSFLPPTKRFVLPVMVVSQALPVFAIAPLLALWFGFGLASKIVMATIAIFFPVASAYHDGLARTDPQLLDLSRLYGANRLREVAVLRVPSALPSLIIGVRLAAVYAPIGALIGEWVGASSGLGYAMLQAQGPLADGGGLRLPLPARGDVDPACAPPSISSPATSPPGRPSRPERTRPCSPDSSPPPSRWCLPQHRLPPPTS